MYIDGCVFCCFLVCTQTRSRLRESALCASQPQGHLRGSKDGDVFNGYIIVRRMDSPHFI